MRTLADHHLFDVGLRAQLEALCERTAAAAGRRVAVVTAQLDSAELLLAAHGDLGVFRDCGGLPSEWSLWPHAERRASLLELADTACVPALAANPFVEASGVRSYAAVPLTSVEGTSLGLIAVADRRPGALGAAGRAALLEAAAQARWLLAGARGDA